MRGRIVVGAVATLAFALGGVENGMTQAQQPPLTNEQLGHVRVERTLELDDRWRVATGSDFGNVVQLFSESVDTPSSAEEMDVVVSVSLDARTSKSDMASLSVTHHVQNGFPHPPGRMPPGEFKLVSPSPRIASVHHASWAARLSTQGFPVTFTLDVRADDGPDADRRARASGRKLTVVIEMWTAGD